jgi:hypothetical protein
MNLKTAILSIANEGDVGIRKTRHSPHLSRGQVSVARFEEIGERADFII